MATPVGKRFQFVVKGMLLVLFVFVLAQPLEQPFMHAVTSVPSSTFDGSRTLTVMTYNIRHGRDESGRLDLQRIADTIAAYDADIVGLQEVDRYIWRSRMADQPKRLGEILDMSWSYAPGIGTGWMQYGNAVLSRYEQLSSRMASLPGRTESRSVMRVEVDVDGIVVEVWNTHLGMYIDEREVQMIRLLDELEKASEPSILIGDFNMEGDDELLLALHKDWSKVEVEGATLVSGKQVDHVFIRGPLHIVEAFVAEKSGSDHLPVIVVLEWMEEERGNMIH